eukprot:TRINITY_DN5180_c0_g1_i1.p1 TRINITY_DN5180_c0_g1~~TRINITY_DN5180_c0_g1_i1.p1  ORF type:complete len:200 (+),score=28.78 TRINITY_DN5180_c0_g1_i1:48-602(+)
MNTSQQRAAEDLDSQANTGNRSEQEEHFSPYISHPLENPQQDALVVRTADPLPDGYYFGGPMQMDRPFNTPYVEPSGPQVQQQEHVLEYPRPEHYLQDPDWTDHEQEIFCPHCFHHGISETTKRPALFVAFLIMAILIAGIFFWPVLCFLVLAIPFLLPPLWTVRHYCPNCGEMLGYFSRIHSR